MFQLLNADPIQLDEGGPSAVINFTSTAPPSVLCVAGGQASDCAVAVVAYTQDQPSLKCLNSRALPQLLFPEGSQSKLCTVGLTNENWRSTGSIVVSANQDGWLDGPTNSTVTLTVSLGNDGFYDVSDKSLRVSTDLFCFSLYSSDL